MTITLGYWLIPLLITLIVFAGAQVARVKRNSFDEAHFGVIVVLHTVALIISLVAWLIYFIIT